MTTLARFFFVPFRTVQYMCVKEDKEQKKKDFKIENCVAIRTFMPYVCACLCCSFLNIRIIHLSSFLCSLAYLLFRRRNKKLSRVDRRTIIEVISRFGCNKPSSLSRSLFFSFCFVPKIKYA